MDYIKHKLISEELEGVKVNKDITVCIRLFADDMGVFIDGTKHNFKALQSILTFYKMAAGTKMNLTKTVIIPLGFSNIPQWIQDTGCKISGPRGDHAPIGYLLRQTEMHSFCLDKISKRNLGWSNQLLSLTGRTILIQHEVHGSSNQDS